MAKFKCDFEGIPCKYFYYDIEHDDKPSCRYLEATEERDFTFAPCGK